MDEYVSTILERLTKRYGAQISTELSNQNITELFVAVLLSPQSTDKQTNRVTAGLFKRYKTFDDYASADLAKLQKDMSGMNYYKTKAKNLQRSSRLILSQFGGKVPRTLAELMTLPGVGRKVANVIQNEGFHTAEGIAVDTHCGRVARRLHLSRRKDPKKVEQDLMRKVDSAEWRRVSNIFIALGRDTCKARNKECHRCVLRDICPSSDVKV